MEVTNTGDVAGKDVVQVYFTLPYTNGEMEKASVNLADFGKTGTLGPGASETISFEINKEELAAYDSGAKNGGYVLEEGKYVISIRSNSHEVIGGESFVVDEGVIYMVKFRTYCLCYL